MWRQWRPALNADKTLGEALATMPRDPPSKVPWQIRLFENPESRFAMPGAISLYRHDCLHALLCTSFYSECEAWTIGFTMGTDDNLRPWQIRVFKWWSRTYPGAYKFDRNDRANFDVGLEYGKRSPVRFLQGFPFEQYEGTNMNELRRMLGMSWILTDSNYQNWAMRWEEKWFMYEAEIVASPPGQWEWPFH